MERLALSLCGTRRQRGQQAQLLCLCLRKLNVLKLGFLTEIVMKWKGRHSLLSRLGTMWLLGGINRIKDHAGGSGGCPSRRTQRMGGRPGLARATSRLFKMFKSRTEKRMVALVITQAAGRGLLQTHQQFCTQQQAVGYLIRVFVLCRASGLLLLLVPRLLGKPCLGPGGMDVSCTCSSPAPLGAAGKQISEGWSALGILMFMACLRLLFSCVSSPNTAKWGGSCMEKQKAGTWNSVGEWS